MYTSELLSTEKPEINLGGSGLNKKVIIMTRQCFNKLCILSRKPRSQQVAMFFAKVYEAAIEYAQMLRSKSLMNVSKLKENKEDAKKRIDDLVKQRVNKTNEAKLEKDIKELHKSLDYKTAKILELETTVEERDKSLRIVRENVDKANYQVSVVEEEKRKVKKELLKALEELKIMKDSSVSVEIYEKKQKETEDLTIVFNEYKTKYNILIKKYNCVIKKYNEIVLKNKSKDEEISLLSQSKDQEISLLSQQNCLLLARITELEKMVVKPANINTKISSSVVKSSVKPVDKISSPVKPVDMISLPVKQVIKSPHKPVTKTIYTSDVKLTKLELSAKTINALKDICREKNLAGFSSHKTKSSLIDWMLFKL
jgi:chromosome segregation ATPase